MTGPDARLPKDDDWCDWCGKEISPQTRRTEDNRVFCSDRCLAEYRRRGDLAHAVVELPVDGGPDES